MPLFCVTVAHPETNMIRADSPVLLPRSSLQSTRGSKTHDSILFGKSAHPARFFYLAHSTAKCNGEIFGVEENLTRSSVAEYLSGTRVEFVLDPWISVSDTIERSEPFGKYCLNRPLVCSLRPRSHE